MNTKQKSIGKKATRVLYIDGRAFKEMLSAAADWLEKSVADIDALNVFPVPDGDCGTNMYLTMRAITEEADKVMSGGAWEVAQAVAKGALMGARGNSGVILSQIWRGFAGSLEKKDTIDAREFARGLLEGSKMAYKALANPVEGTILTVIREVAAAAVKETDSGEADIVKILAIAVRTARRAVAETPSLLPVLGEAGVVDAGGQGLYTILEGTLFYFRGKQKSPGKRKSRIIGRQKPAKPVAIAPGEKGIVYGFCTQFLLESDNLDPDKVREELKANGQSLIVAGERPTLRVHIHTTEPDKIIKMVSSMGRVSNVSIANMDEQHEEFVASQKEKVTDLAIVAVASGEGLVGVFRSLGAAAVIPGGQTMNPSVRDILRPVQAMPADKVILLPNNKNVVLTARQVGALTAKDVAVIPTETIPQGVAALLAIDNEADFQANVANMRRAIAAVKTIEITRATRTARLGRLDIEKGQVIGLLDGELLAAGEDNNEVVRKLLAGIDLSGSELITIYYGGEIKPNEAAGLSAAIQGEYPAFQVEVVAGGQPHYDYIISIE